MAVINVESDKGQAGAPKRAPEMRQVGKKGARGPKKGEAIRLRVYGPAPGAAAAGGGGGEPNWWVVTCLVKVVFPEIIPLRHKKLAAMLFEAIFAVIWFSLSTLSFETLMVKYLNATNTTNGSADGDDYELPIHVQQLVEAITPNVAMTLSAMNQFAVVIVIIYAAVLILLGLLCWGIKKESENALIVWTGTQVACTFLLTMAYTLYAIDNSFFNFVGAFYIFLICGRIFATGFVINIILNIHQKNAEATAAGGYI